MIRDVVDASRVFDPTALVDLTGHESDHEFARVLAGRYRGLLPGRVRRIVAALRAEDHDEAMDAVLSLKVSSGTLGAHELASLGATVERHLRMVDLPGAHAAAAALPAAAERLEGELAAYLA